MVPGSQTIVSNLLIDVCAREQKGNEKVLKLAGINSLS
jgi:hypothetical protein